MAHLRDGHGMSVGQYVKTYPDSAFVSGMVKEMIRIVVRDPQGSKSAIRGVVDRLTKTDSLGIQALVSPSGGSFSSGFDVVKWRTLLAPKIAEWDAALQAHSNVQSVISDFEFTDNSAMIALALLLDQNCLVTGTTGCGKTEELIQTFLALGVPFERANMNGQVTYNSFVGRMMANSEGTYFVNGLLPNAMLGGYPIILDEFDFTPPHIAAVLYPAMEKHPTINIVESGQQIKAKPGFRIFATGNTLGKGDTEGRYTGTEVQSAALMDRFGMKLVADYLSKDVELKLVERRFPSVDLSVMRKAIALANEMRSAFKLGDVSLPFSTRRLLDFAESLMAAGLDIALHTTILNWLEGVELALVQSLIAKVGFNKKIQNGRDVYF